MRKTFCLLSSAFAVTVLCFGQAQAEDGYYASGSVSDASVVTGSNVSFSNLDERINAIEAALHNGGEGGGACCDGPSTYASYEVTMLNPEISEANNLGATGFSNQYGTGHRIILGRNLGGGVGARIRYWFYNHGHGIGQGAGAGTNLSIDMDVADFEITLNEQLRNWDLEVSGGIRYARQGIDSVASGTDFEGWGPTVSLEATRDVGCRGLYLVGNFRASLLVGRIANPNAAAFGGIAAGTAIYDEITTTLENQLGLGYAREMGCYELDLRLLWETQFWLNDTYNDSTNGLGSNLGFNGVTASVGINF